MMGEVIVGLHYMHSKNAVHGDLNTTHIFIEKDYSLRIGGYGSLIRLAMATNNNAEEPEGGKPILEFVDLIARYAAPELYETGKPTKESDLYALGVVLYEIIMQQPPFPNLSANAIKNKVCVLNETLKFLPLPLKVPRRIVKLVEQLWHPDPSSRLKSFGSLTELRKKIDKL
jgi:serine/threonine protein kinase